MIADGRNIMLHSNGLNPDIVEEVINYYNIWKCQPEGILTEIQDIPVSVQCESIYAYLLKNVNYKVDPEGKQFIKSPARLLADGFGDCKSFTVFIASCLHCLGVPHTIRFANYYGGSQYTHVYPIAYDEQGKAIVLDACPQRDRKIKYDYEARFINKKDFYFQ